MKCIKKINLTTKHRVGSNWYHDDTIGMRSSDMGEGEQPMSFCCGASKIGVIGAITSEQVVVHQVPLLFCPICHDLEVHHSVRDEFELLVDYAQADGLDQIDFSDYVGTVQLSHLLENCISVEQGKPELLYREQIDNALDLLGVAKQLSDPYWEETLKYRLKVLSGRWRRYRQGQNV